jgi:(S)-mandelate dehydrogenase
MSLASQAARAFSIEDLRTIARKRLPRAIFEFYDGGAEDEVTLRDNLEAFKRVRILPRALNNVSKVDLSCELVGGPAAMPLAIAPTGAANFGRHGADLAIARAAAAMGVPYALSTSATTTIEQIAQAAPGRLWFQAYILADKQKLATLIDRARAADYEGLMITVDLPVGGKRERDFRNHLQFPFKYTPRNVLDFASRPLWSLGMLLKGVPQMENIKELKRDTGGGQKLSSTAGKNYDPAFDWAQLQIMRDNWSRKLIVKGVMHPNDADRLARMGVDAIVVSNHGGRQLDGAPATLDALPGVVRAAAGRVPVLVDGGVRRGIDILKARALGAQGVLTGRATLFGALAAGQPGAARALGILKDELSRSMQLSGICKVSEIDQGLLFSASHPAA